MDTRPVEAPDLDALAKEVIKVRERGITRLSSLKLPALRQAVLAAGMTSATGKVEAPQIERLLRVAVERFGEGRYGDCASIMFGLAPGTRGDDPVDLRAQACEAWGCALTYFQKKISPRLCRETAHQVLLIVQEHQERLAHLSLERRLPTTSRLAVAWLERFEAYYRIWTPVSGLGGDLSAYRATLLEADRPWDRPAGTKSPDDPGYTQEEQAAGYVTFALWHYTCTLVGVKHHLNRYGGLWLLSDAKAEESLADAVYRITWHSPNNERDDSYLRIVWDQAQGELDGFLRLIAKDPVLRDILGEWLDWAGKCRCTWDVGQEVDSEHFPTHRHHAGIREGCLLHDLVRACNDYCTLIDDDWQRIADWYHIPGEAPRPSNDREMYVSHTARQHTTAVDGGTAVHECEPFTELGLNTRRTLLR